MLNQEQYDNLRRIYPTVDMVRPFWDPKQYHQDYWKNLNVSVLICQRKTKDTIQLCLESLLRFYPDIPILVVDGDSQDDSSLYLAYKAIVCPNIKIWTRVGRNSHGETMHEAIMGHVTTEYLLILDSDVITMRHGYIEGMLQQLINTKMYATGTLMLVSRVNFGCGIPWHENDILRYAHASCALYHVPTYKTLAPFRDHGAACCYNMIDAADKGIEVGCFPVDKYVLHLSGGSWTNPRTIWSHDNDVPLRPFVTFIVTNEKQVLELANQDDHDFDILSLGNACLLSVVVHGFGASMVTNNIYDLRFKAHGEYVCMLDPSITRVDKVIVNHIKKAVIEQKAPDLLYVGGLKVVKRHIWQRNDCLL